MRFWMSATSVGSVVWRSFTRAPASSIRIDGLVRQEAIGDEARRRIDRGFDGFVGIGDGVELFVAFLDAEENLDGIEFVGRRNLDGLEAAFEGAILFDRLAEFGGVVARCH